MCIRDRLLVRHGARLQEAAARLALRAGALRAGGVLRGGGRRQQHGTGRARDHGCCPPRFAGERAGARFAKQGAC
eukprot:11090941-Alexandrium_andersonii.AAC.1